MGEQDYITECKGRGGITNESTNKEHTFLLVHVKTQ